MFVTKAMSDAGALEEIQKRFGDYDTYRQDALNYDREPVKRPIAKKTAAELEAGRVQSLAKAFDMDLPEFFKRHPAEYEHYRQTSSLRKGGRLQPSVED